jgi:hypothetical protein
MSAILRILSKESDGTLCSRLFEIEGISTEITIREPDPDSIESTVLEENPVSYPEFEEYKLAITRKDGSEVTIEAGNYESCEFEVRDEEGEVVTKTESLFVLDQALMIARLKSQSMRNKAIAALNQKKQ